MSRWDRFDFRNAGPKKPPPEHGIRMKKAGATWWGKRWIDALEHVLRGDSGRLARGRTYARAGRAHDLSIEGGEVSARVTGSRAKPYAVTIELAQLSEDTWRRAIASMAQKAQFSAELLAGEMPKDIDDAFREAGGSLFPRERRELKTKCSCPDWGDPCKHVAATHYILGEAFDRDPFLLFELRGKRKDHVLEALRRARGGEAAPAPRGKRKAGAAARSTPASHAEDAIPEIPVVRLGVLKDGDYDQPRAPLPPLHFSFDGPVSHGAVLRQLGAPATWQAEESPADVLAPLVRAAANLARNMALAEPHDTEPSAADEKPEGPAPSSPPKSPNRRRPAKTRPKR